MASTRTPSKKRSTDSGSQSRQQIRVNAQLIFVVCGIAILFASVLRYWRDHELLEWMRENGGYIHPGLKIAPTWHNGIQMTGVITTKDLQEDEILARVPEKLWLDISLQAMPLKDMLALDGCRLDDNLAMKLAVAIGIAVELRKRSASFFAPMLSMMPTVQALREFYPYLAAPPVFADFGVLPLLSRLRAAHEDDLSKMRLCFQAQRTASEGDVSMLTLDDLDRAVYIVNTRAINGPMVPALLDIFNTGSGSEINMKHGVDHNVFVIRISKAVAAGSEILNGYCNDCDNELMLSGWGVYLENNENQLNDLEELNCSIATALRDATLALLDLHGMRRNEWRSPRCVVGSVTSDQQVLRCSLARYAWERCASAWGLMEPALVDEPFKSGGGAKRRYAGIYVTSSVDRMLQGDLLGAKTNVKSALKVFPEDAELHKLLGTIQQDLGEVSDAIHSFEMALELDPTISDVKEVLDNARAAVSIHLSDIQQT